MTLIRPQFLATYFSHDLTDLHYFFPEINVCLLPRSSGGNNKTRVPSNICGDHGVCHSLPGGNFTCSCHEGYTGARCQDGMSGDRRGVTGECEIMLLVGLKEKLNINYFLPLLNFESCNM
jgi:hypothetical protein